MTTSDSQAGFAEISGAPLYYEVAGAGPVLVLLHEGIADSRMFDDQFSPLAEHARVVRYDLHGFGRSGVPTQPYSHHGALRELLAYLGIERATLLGMSLGGEIAIDFTLTYPEMVDGLMPVAAGVGGWVPTDAANVLFAPLAEAFQTGDFPRAIDLSVRMWVDGPGRAPDAVDPAIRERVRGWYTAVLNRSREGNRPPEQLDPPAIGRLSEIHAPTLVVVGAEDVPDVLAQADLLATSIPSVRKVVVPDAAHVLNMERPDLLNRLVLDFMRDAVKT
jgi:3-oxoadipate enol-lactonase